MQCMSCIWSLASMLAVEHPCFGRKPCMSRWKVIPVLNLVCRMVVISFQIVSSSPMPHTLPGLFLGISTSMLQCRRVGSSPVLKASMTMLTSIIHGCGLVCRSWYQVRRSSVRMPLGPGDLPVCIWHSAVAILPSSGASSGMSKRLNPHRGDPCGSVHWYNSRNSCPMRSSSLGLGGKIRGFFL